MSFKKFCSRGVAPLVLAGAALFCAERAFAAGAAYQVDTAEVSAPGACKVESWASFGRGSDYIAATSPACVVNLFRPFDLSAQFASSRIEGDTSYSITPKAKTNLIPSGIGVWGVAISASASIDAQTGETTALNFNVPATIRLSNQARINVNAGYMRDRSLQRDFATYGAGIDWRTADNVWILTAEVFGLTGASSEDALPGNNRPRGQAGIRWRPIDALSFDVIYGQNLAGERNHWITFATVYRFNIGGTGARRDR